jgi:methyl-accepting chemotaxis protein
MFSKGQSIKSNNAAIVIKDNAASIGKLSDELEFLSSSINKDLSSYKL